MAITTYTELQSAIADWIDRNDQAARIPDFISLAEAKIRRRVRRKTIRTTLNVSAESTPLPSDLAELRSVYPLTGTPSRDRPLDNATPEMLAELRARHGAVSGRPLAFAIIDDDLVVAPAPDQTYSLQITYFQKLVALSSSAESNATLTEAPDIYLYGSLAEAGEFLVDDGQVAQFKADFDAAIEELNQVRIREETTASLKKARLPVVYG